jgi:hypothetical protein
LLLAVILLAPRSASAGRTFYGWLYGTEVLPERGAELMSWIAEENNLEHENHASETRWWIGPLIGINDQLELALPVEIAWGKSDVEPGHTVFDKYGAELRYRLVTSDPVDAPPLVPLVRVAVKRSVTERDKVEPEADIVVSYNTGGVQVLADVGGYAELSTCSSGEPAPCASTHFEIRPGAGVSFQAVGDLRFGAEIHAELSLDDNAGSWAIVGPNLAWSHGRFWLSAMYGIGFYGIKDAPKVQWGVAF